MLDSLDPTLQLFARPVDEVSWTVGLGGAIPGLGSASLLQSSSLPWSGDTGSAGALIQDPSAAGFGAKFPNGAQVQGAGANDPITGMISLEGASVVGSTLRAVLGPTSAPPTAIRYQWQRAASGSESFIDISGATELSYTPAAQDLGLSLRIQASLTNRAGLDNPVLSLRSPVVQRLIEAQGNTLLSQNPISERLSVWRGGAGASVALELNVSLPSGVSARAAERASDGNLTLLSYQAPITTTRTITEMVVISRRRTTVTRTVTDTTPAVYLLSRFDSTSGGALSLNTPLSAATTAASEKLFQLDLNGDGIIPAPDPPAPRLDGGTGSLSPIAGELLEGSILRAGSISGDPDGAATITTYAWSRLAANGSETPLLSGPNAASYTPTAADVGSRLRLQVSYTDPQGFNASLAALTSGPIAAVPAPPAPVVTPPPVSPPPPVVTPPVITPPSSPAPAVISGDLTAELVEANGVNSISGSLSLQDPANPAAAFAPIAASAGTYGWLQLNAQGAWTYTTSSSLDGLAAGDRVRERFEVRSADGATSATLTIWINGSDDPATIADPGRLELRETNAPLSLAGSVAISDPDRAALAFQPLRQDGAFGTLALAADGTWTYRSFGNLDRLAAGEKVLDRFDLTAADGSATRLLTIAINGTDDRPVISGALSVAVRAGSEAITATGRLSIADADNPSATFDMFEGRSGSYGTLSLTGDGRWTYRGGPQIQALTTAQSLQERFQLQSADGLTSQTLVLDILGSQHPSQPLSVAAVLESYRTGKQVLHSGQSLVESTGNTVLVAEAGGGLRVDRGNGAFRLTRSDGTPISVATGLRAVAAETAQDGTVTLLTSRPASTSTQTITEMVVVNRRRTMVTRNVITTIPAAHFLSSFDAATGRALSLDVPLSTARIGEIEKLFQLDLNSDGVIPAPDPATTAGGGSPPAGSGPSSSGIGSVSPTVSGRLSIALDETNAALQASGRLTIADPDNPAAAFTPLTASSSYGSLTLAADG
ncbi:MAG: VCBS domain-containing protein, partial [Cyanobium sp.]